MAKGNQPHFRVAMMDKRTDLKNGNIGAAWKNDDGTISVILDAFITVPPNTGDLLITLFPKDYKVKKNPNDDEVPF